MGKPTWDKISALDSEVALSVAHLQNAREMFIMHRELEVGWSTARRLARALDSEHHFQKVAPWFLRHWKGAKNQYLLKAIAKLIETGKLAGNSAWRFNVTPLPLSAAKRNVAYHFEIRFICTLNDVISPLRLGSVGTGLRQSAGPLNPSFTRALTEVMSAMRGPHKTTYPGGAQILSEAFDVPLPPVPKTRKKAKKPAAKKKK